MYNYIGSRTTKYSLFLIALIIICCKKVRAPFLTVNVLEFPSCRFRSGEKVLSIVNAIPTFFFYPFLTMTQIFFNMHNHLSRSNWIIMASSASFSFPFTKKPCKLLTKTAITPLMKVGNSTYIYLLRYNVHSLKFFFEKKM